MSSLCLLTGTLVLADNVDGEDDLDLIVTTMNGNVFCFSTQSPHHLLEEITKEVGALWSAMSTMNQDINGCSFPPFLSEPQELCLWRWLTNTGFISLTSTQFTFHTHYFKLLKWIVVQPMLGMFCVFDVLWPQEGAPLPSFSRNID